MRNFFMLLLLIPLLDSSGCDKESTERMEDFWPLFQEAIAQDNRIRVAALTNFPLPGAEPFVRSNVYVAAGILPEQFLESYDRIFDERARAFLTRTPLSDLERYTVTPESYAEMLGIPTGTEVYALSVPYVFNQGTEKQTESTVSFHFIRIGNGFRLGFIDLAG